MDSHPDQTGWEFRLTCVLNTVALLMASSRLKKALPFRVVELALAAPIPCTTGGEGDTGGRRELWCSVLPIQEHEVVKAILEEACVGADRGADRPVCACGPGPHQRLNRGAHGGSPVPRPRTRQDIAEAVQLVRVEQPIKDRTAPVPQMKHETMEVIQPVAVERIKDRIR